MEKVILKDSMEENHTGILQGLKDSKEYFSEESVLNPLQNSSGNHTSA